MDIDLLAGTKKVTGREATPPVPCEFYATRKKKLLATHFSDDPWNNPPSASVHIYWWGPGRRENGTRPLFYPSTSGWKGQVTPKTTHRGVADMIDRG